MKLHKGDQFVLYRRRNAPCVVYEVVAIAGRTDRVETLVIYHLKDAPDGVVYATPIHLLEGCVALVNVEAVKP